MDDHILDHPHARGLLSHDDLFLIGQSQSLTGNEQICAAVNQMIFAVGFCHLFPVQTVFADGQLEPRFEADFVKEWQGALAGIIAEEGSEDFFNGLHD